MKPTPSTRQRRAAAILAAIVASPVLALASEAAHEGGHGAAHGPDPAAWISLGFSFFNFFVFVFLIRKYVWPAVRDFLSGRRREVAEAMEAAARARQEADQIRAEFAAKEAALEETRRRMLEEIRSGAEADRNRLLVDARAAAERLKAEAARQAEHDLARARRELRAEAARLAAELAEKDVRSRLGDADRARLVSEFVEGVARG